MKKTLRRRHLLKRKKLGKRAAGLKSAKIVEKLVTTPEFRNAHKILFYHPIRNEVNCLPALKQALALRKKVFLPRMNEKKMQVVEVRKMAEMRGLKAGNFGIKEPRGRASSPKEIDLVLVPAVAYDWRGFRVGYGGGYYDMLLAKTRAGRIGLCYETNLVRRIPAEEHDQPVGKIITEKRTIDARKTS